MSPHGFLLATPPTTSPCPLPGHDPASNGPSAVPLPLSKATVCFLARGEQGVEYPLNVIKLFWSRSDIMHVAIAWGQQTTVLLTTALLPNRTTESFQMEAGPPYDKQRIQMGLRKGNTVLIYFRSGVGHYQCVLIALASDLSTNKPWQGQHMLTLLWCKVG